MSKKIKLSILAFLIIILVLTIQSKAENNLSNSTVTSEQDITNNTSNTNTAISDTSSNNTTSTSNISDSSTTTKSNIATLSNLGIKPKDFSGFKSDIVTYNTTVPYETESIEVYAKKGHNEQTITGTGTKKLNVGLNKIEIIVIAEDGISKKTYTINVTRQEKDENEENTEEDLTFGLSELKIQGINLEPEFQTDIYEYKIELKEDLEKLDLSTLATEIGAEIEIIGNENLKEGENIITIIVKDKNEEKNATYQIIVNKIVENLEEDNNRQKKKMFIIGGGIVLGVVVLILTIAVIKFKKKKSIKTNRENENFMKYNNINNFYKESIQDTVEDKENDDFANKKKNIKGKRFR